MSHLRIPTLSLTPNAEEQSSYALAFRLSQDGAPDEEVAAHMRAASVSGDVRADYSIASCLLAGVRGFQHDPVAAVPLLKRAAAGNVVEAMFDLGVSFDRGIGVQADPREAYCWYLRAALRGDLTALSYVANYSTHGHGVARDDQVALVWYEVAEVLGVDAEEAKAFRKTMGEELSLYGHRDLNSRPAGASDEP